MKSLKVISAVDLSKNVKTGPVSATYAPVQTCPSTCPLKDKGCYAQSGKCAIHFRNISKNADNMKIVEIATSEALAIDSLAGVLPLRLHVTGDCPDNESAMIVSAACERYMERSGQPVWAYTHAWDVVDRSSWKSVTVLASCETSEQVKLARKRGYKTAWVTPLSTVAQRVKSCVENNIKPVLCKNFVSGKSCTQCRTCWADDKDSCMLLPTHGARAKTADKTVIELEG